MAENKIKITKSYLKQVIKEELNYILLEQNSKIEEGPFLRRAAGALAGMALGAVSPSTAQAAEPTGAGIEVTLQAKLPPKTKQLLSAIKQNLESNRLPQNHQQNLERVLKTVEKKLVKYKQSGKLLSEIHPEIIKMLNDINLGWIANGLE